MLETNRGVVHPWLCDVMGHFTTRHYTAVFDDASYHLSHACGVSVSADSDIGFVDAQLTMKFISELPVGALFYIRSGFTKLGTKSFTMFHQMYNCSDDSLVATVEEVAVFFNLKTRTSIAIPEDFRAKALTLLLKNEDH